MRYVSDLHLGRVNPHLIHHDLDIDHTNFDLSEFLRNKVVNASDKEIQIAIEAVETVPHVPQNQECAWDVPRTESAR